MASRCWCVDGVASMASRRWRRVDGVEGTSRRRVDGVEGTRRRRGASGRRETEDAERRTPAPPSSAQSPASARARTRGPAPTRRAPCRTIERASPRVRGRASPRACGRELLGPLPRRSERGRPSGATPAPPGAPRGSVTLLTGGRRAPKHHRKTRRRPARPRPRRSISRRHQRERQEARRAARSCPA